MIAALALRPPPARRIGILVTPGTTLRWHRRPVTRRWTTEGRPERAYRRGPALVDAGVARDEATFGQAGRGTAVIVPRYMPIVQAYW